MVVPSLCRVPRLALVVALATAARPVVAQVHSSVLAGKVALGTESRALANADVDMPGLHRTTKTDSAGLFVITDIPSGAFVVRVRALGYEELSTSLLFTGMDTVARLFLLNDGHVVASGTEAGSEGELDKFAAFRRRHARGNGFFIVRAQMQGMEAQPLSELLRRYLPAIVLHTNSRGAIAVASGRGVGPTQIEAAGDGFPLACYTQVFVDGQRMFSGGTHQLPQNINEYRTEDVEAIEYYPAPELTPPEFAGAGAQCGTVSLWLRIN